MNPAPTGPAAPQTVQKFIDAVCVRFRADWHAGRRPRLEHALGALPEPARTQLLRNLLTIEVEQRLLQGEEVNEAEYLERFPASSSFLGLVIAAARANRPRPAARSLPSGRSAEGETPWDTPSPVSSPLNRASLGDYEVLGILGQGGMGVVYRARQKSQDRLVALKLIRADRLAALPPDQRQPWLERFRAEALAAAHLSHEAVLPVFDVGLHGQQPYYSMRLIEGRSLADRLRHGPLPDRDAAICLERVARGVHHAHQHGVLHRDIKPSNILLDAAGNAFVTDFGLAKGGEGSPGATMTGQFLGSPPYASPEQARDTARTTPVSDVYSLGATLYHALTGRPPFLTASAAGTLRLVEKNHPVPPRILNPEIAPDLENICLRCLEKTPQRRYASAAALAEDLRRFLEDRRVEARPAPWKQRLYRWLASNPLAGSLMGASALLLLGALALAGWGLQQRREALSQIDEAAERSLRAEEGQLQTQEKQQAAQIASGLLALRQGAWREALACLDQVSEDRFYPKLRLARVRAGLALGQTAVVERELAHLRLCQAPEGPAGLVDLYRGEMLLGTDPQGEELIRAALARGLPPAERCYARALVEAKTSTEAVDLFQQTVILDPHHEEARASAVLLLLLLGRKAEAEALLARSTGLFPDSHRLIMVRLVRALLEGDSAGAERFRASLKDVIPETDLDSLQSVIEAGRALISGAAQETSEPLSPEMLRRVVRAQRVAPGMSLGRLVRVPVFLTPLLQGASFDLLAIPLSTPVTAERVDRAARLAAAHPEGTLTVLHARLALAFAEQHRPGTGQDDRTYTDHLKAAATAFEAATRQPSLFPIRAGALDRLIHIETLLGSAERARPDGAARDRAVAHVRERLMDQGLSVSADMWEIYWTAATQANATALARSLLTDWARQYPEDPRLPHCRAYTEFQGGAYGPAARAAQAALIRKPQDPLLRRILAQSLERLRAELAEIGP